MNLVEEIKMQIAQLNMWTKAYDEGNPMVSDKEWDEAYFRLADLEGKTGLYFPNSPTQSISYEVVNKLNKVTHNHKMLSLNKTKDWNEFLNYFNSTKDVIGMLKLDGLTCSLRYENGLLVAAETRGNGEVGEDILHNAKVIPSIPTSIPYKEELVIDGEIICTYKNFEEFSNEYKNPRNFASGSIRLLDSKECARRKLTFVAWNIVKGFEEENSFMKKLFNIEKIGFTVTPYTSSFDFDAKDFLQDRAKELSYPIDGLVGRYDDIAYGESLGGTAHHSNAAFAFKFYDEEYETELLDIEWTMGRTGVLTPVAIFEPIDIDGTIVSRASLHNISIAHKILGGHAFGWKGQKVFVYKANMIIPQISRAEEDNDLTKYYFNLPSVCPICGGNVEVRKEIDSEMLYCTNSQCDGKLVNKIDHFFGKKGLDAKGFSRATIQKIIDWGYVENISDCFRLDEYRADWIKRPGFGEKSVTSILTALDGCRNTSLNKIIAAAGIPLIGSTVSKSLAKKFKTYDEFRTATREVDFSTLDGFGYEMNSALHKFDYTELDYIVENFLTIEVEKAETEAVLPLEGLVLPFENKIFVITGRLQLIQNREKLINIVEKNGGKVSSSISSKTSVLINNDINSSSAKNKKAKELNIPIITEEEFLKQCVIKE